MELRYVRKLEELDMKFRKPARIEKDRIVLPDKNIKVKRVVREDDNLS